MNTSIQYIFSHRNILWRITQSELKIRYAGSFLGITWSFVAPALILIIYAVVYLFIFRVQPAGMTTPQYVLYIFSGLVPYLMTAESLSFGVSAVIASKAVLSNTVFPIDLTPVKAVLLAQGTAVVGFVLIILGTLAVRIFAITALFLPVIWLLLVLFLIGVNWFISLINIVLRDLQYLINPLLMILMISSPIAYTPEMIPSALRILILLNPFAYFFSALQRILVLGQVPDLSNWIIMLVLSLGGFGLGGWFFFRAKRVLIDYV